MKRRDIEPTEENLVLTLRENLIDRNIELKYFVDVLNSLEDGFSISLEGQWGSGKTFFVKQAIMILTAYNKLIPHNSELDNEIKQVWETMDRSNTLSIEPQLPIYYDAWSNDNDIDPVLSLVYTIIQDVGAEFDGALNRDLIGAFTSIADIVTGWPISSVTEKLKKEDLFAEIRKSKNLQSEISSFINSLLPEKANRMVIFIDELDRCKPTFAVSLLERIKHYFINEKVTFVFSVNVEELQYTIKQVYGAGFNASRYLDRFFDLRLQLSPPNLEKYYESIGMDSPEYVYNEVIKEITKRYSLTLREISKVYLSASIGKKNFENYRRSMYDAASAKAVDFAMHCVLPVAICLNIVDHSEYEQFKSGKNPNALDFLAENRAIYDVLYEYLLIDEEQKEYGQDCTRAYSKLCARLSDAYKGLFEFDFEKFHNNFMVGKMLFNKEVRSTVFRALSLLSEYADYDR